ncbi:MAG: hypothetical protein ABIQ35_04580 [Verrucomicrobiota bacterium]
MSRNGKIARLPKHIHDMVGEKLSNGEQCKQLVEWLNGVNCVQEVLKEQFQGRPVSEQNHSEWKQGGYQDWQRDQETKQFITRLTELSGDLDEASDGKEISDRFAAVVAAEIAKLALILMEKETDPEKRWKQLCEVHRELSQLGRDDHRAIRMLIKREGWERHKDQEEEEEDKRVEQKRREQMCAPLWAQLKMGPLAEMFGGGEWVKDVAAFILKVQNDLRMGQLGVKVPTVNGSPAKLNPIRLNQTKSNWIKPNK